MKTEKDDVPFLAMLEGFIVYRKFCTIQSMEFSRSEYWSGSPFPSSGDLPNSAIDPGLPHCRWILYQLSYQGSLRILEWVACPFSSGFSRPSI